MRIKTKIFTFLCASKEDIFLFYAPKRAYVENNRFYRHIVNDVSMLSTCSFGHISDDDLCCLSGTEQHHL
jgi:predicted solute-binding protein